MCQLRQRYRGSFGTDFYDVVRVGDIRGPRRQARPGHQVGGGTSGVGPSTTRLRPKHTTDELEAEARYFFSERV